MIGDTIICKIYIIKFIIFLTSFNLGKKNIKFTIFLNKNK